MGKWDVDFDDYEEKEQSGYDGEVPKKGTYTGELVSLGEHTSGAGNEGLEWIFEITEGDYKGWRGWVYSNMDSAKWKTQQIVKAISGGAEKAVKLDPGTDQDSKTSNKTVKKAKKVRLRLGRETYDDEPRAKIRTVMPMDGESGGGGKKKKKGDDPF